jgi:hypothetical protein
VEDPAVLLLWNLGCVELSIAPSKTITLILVVVQYLPVVQYQTKVKYIVVGI